jgi:hypothetical protein
MDDVLRRGTANGLVQDVVRVVDAAQAVVKAREIGAVDEDAASLAGRMLRSDFSGAEVVRGSHSDNVARELQSVAGRAAMSSSTAE